MTVALFNDFIDQYVTFREVSIVQDRVKGPFLFTPYLL